MSYALRVAVARQHRFARMRKVRSVACSARPLAAYAQAEYLEYHEMLETIFTALEVRPGAVECDGATSLLAAVESGRGVAIVPRGLPQPGRLTCETAPDRTDTAPDDRGLCLHNFKRIYRPGTAFLTIVRSVARIGRLACRDSRFKRFVRFEMSSRRPTATGFQSRSRCDDEVPRDPRKGNLKTVSSRRGASCNAT